MVSPASTTFARPDLGASFEAFDLVAERAGLIGARVLPVFESAIGQGNFSKVPVEQLLQEKSLKRTPGAGYAR